MASFLRPCSECRRHVRNDDPTCAFCGAAIVPEKPRVQPFTRYTRAAIFATFAACGGSPPKVDTTKQTQPTIDAGVDSPMLPQDDRDFRRSRCSDDKVPCPMPYGAPPVRRRLV